MDVRDDKRYRCGPLVFDPMGARAKFGEGLAGMELLCCAVVMVIGQNPGPQVDDRRMALVAVEANLPARRYGCPAQPQLAVCDTVDLWGEIDRGEHILGDRFIIDRCALLPQNKACREQHQTGRTRYHRQTNRSHPALPYPV